MVASRHSRRFAVEKPHGWKQPPIGRAAQLHVRRRPWPLGNRERSFFDTKGSTTAVAHADDTKATWTYNSFSEPSVYTDEAGNQTTNAYDSASERSNNSLDTLTCRGKPEIARPRMRGIRIGGCDTALQ